MVGKLSNDDATWRVKSDVSCVQFAEGKFVVVGQVPKNKKKRRASASTEETVDNLFVYDVKDLQQKQLQNKLKEEQGNQPYGFRFWDAIAEVTEYLCKKRANLLK